MAQGVIKVTPRSPGTVEVSQLDPGTPAGVTIGSMLSFMDPGFPLMVGDKVDITIISGTEARVNQKLPPGPIVK